MELCKVAAHLVAKALQEDRREGLLCQAREEVSMAKRRQVRSALHRHRAGPGRRANRPPERCERLQEGPCELAKVQPQRGAVGGRHPCPPRGRVTRVRLQQSANAGQGHRAGFYTGCRAVRMKAPTLRQT